MKRKIIIGSIGALSAIGTGAIITNIPKNNLDKALQKQKLSGFENIWKIKEDLDNKVEKTVGVLRDTTFVAKGFSEEEIEFIDLLKEASSNEWNEKRKYIDWKRATKKLFYLLIKRGVRIHDQYKDVTEILMSDNAVFNWGSYPRWSGDNIYFTGLFTHFSNRNVITFSCKTLPITRPVIKNGIVINRNAISVITKEIVETEGSNFYKTTLEDGKWVRTLDLSRYPNATRIGRRAFEGADFVKVDLRGTKIRHIDFRGFAKTKVETFYVGANTMSVHENSFDDSELLRVDTTEKYPDDIVASNNFYRLNIFKLKNKSGHSTSNKMIAHVIKKSSQFKKLRDDAKKFKAKYSVKAKVEA